MQDDVITNLCHVTTEAAKREGHRQRKVMEEYLFNVDNGYLEGLVRGFRSGILTRTDYINLVQCETIEGEPNDSILSCSTCSQCFRFLVGVDEHSKSLTMFLTVIQI